MIISNILGIIFCTLFKTAAFSYQPCLSFSLHKAVRDVCASVSGLRSHSMDPSVCPFFFHVVCSSGMCLETGQHASFWGVGTGVILRHPEPRVSGKAQAGASVCPGHTENPGVIPAPPSVCCVTLGSSLNLSVPTFSPAQRQACCSSLTVLPKGEVSLHGVDAEDTPLWGRCLAGRF